MSFVLELYINLSMSDLAIYLANIYFLKKANNSIILNKHVLRKKFYLATIQVKLKFISKALYLYLFLYNLIYT
jgi:hypothetical protein